MVCRTKGRQFLTKLDLNSAFPSVTVRQMITYMFRSVKYCVFLIWNEVVSGTVSLGEGDENGCQLYFV